MPPLLTESDHGEYSYPAIISEGGVVHITLPRGTGKYRILSMLGPEVRRYQSKPIALE